MKMDSPTSKTLIIDRIDSYSFENEQNPADYQLCGDKENIFELTLNMMYTSFLKKYKHIDFLRHNSEQNTYTFKVMSFDEKKYVIKTLLLPPDISRITEKQEIERFLIEADLTQIMNNFLHNERVVRVTASGIKELFIPSGEHLEIKQIPYFITEYCDGGNLEQIAAAEFPLQSKIKIFAQIADAISFMHTNYHMIHRDLKPDNILLTKDKNPILIDFGSFEIIGRTGRIFELGTIPYFSQTQAESMLTIGHHNKNQGTLKLSPHTYRTDMYTFTLVIADMIYLDRTDNPVQKIQDLYDYSPDELAYYKYIASDPELVFPETGNTALDKTLAKGISNKPKERFSSMQEMADSLFDLLK